MTLTLVNSTSGRLWQAGKRFALQVGPTAIVIGTFLVFMGVMGSGAREAIKAPPHRIAYAKQGSPAGTFAVVFHLVGTPEQADAARAAIGRTSMELGTVGTDCVYTVLQAGTDQEETRAWELIREAQFGYVEKPGVSVSVVDLRR
jgi:hypothetical protein